MGFHARFVSWHHWADPCLGLREGCWLMPDLPSIFVLGTDSLYTSYLMRHAEGKDHVVYNSDGFWLRYMLTSWGQMVHSQQHQTNPCTPPAGIEMLQEVLNDPGERQPGRARLTSIHSSLAHWLQEISLFMQKEKKRLKGKKLVRIDLNVIDCL